MLIEASAQIRPGQIFILAVAPGLGGQKVMFLGKILVDLREHRILSRRMVRPEAKHGQGLVPGPGLTRT